MLDKVFPLQDKLYDEIMMSSEGDSFDEEKMKKTAEQIFNYNPKTDPRDPLYSKEESKKKK